MAATTDTADGSAFSTSETDYPTVDRSRLGPENGVPRLGVDARGAVHYLDERRDRVIVVDATGAVEHVEQLDTASVGVWIEYVRDKRGWTHGGANGGELIELVLLAIR